MELLNRFKVWLHAPFTQNMDPLHVFLLTGLVMISVILWARFINSIKGLSTE